jgi:long-subunit fatty acid transport protein
MSHIQCSWKVLLGSIGLGIASLSNTALGNDLQNFAPINYSNPADLVYTVENTQAIATNFLVLSNSSFNGMVTVPDLYAPARLKHNVITNGTSVNQAVFNITTGRLAKRFFKNLIIGIEVTEPFKEDIIYSKNSPVRYAATVTKIHSVDVSPIIAYQFSGLLRKLSVGAGFDAFYFDTTLGQEFPSLPKALPTPPFFAPFGSQNDLTFVAHGTDWTYGWHAGVVYRVFRGTFVGLCYFSPLTPKIRGFSAFTGFPTNNNFNATFKLPATTDLEIKQNWNTDWSTTLRIDYIQWHRFNRVILHNTAAPQPTQIIPINSRNTWRIALTSRYNVKPKVTLIGSVAYDQTPTNDTNRTARVNTLSTGTVRVGAEYHLTKKIGLELDYVNLFNFQNVPINNVNPNTGIVTVGHVKTDYNVIGIQININI